VLLFVGFPIYLILFITALIALSFILGGSPTIVQTTIFGSLDSFRCWRFRSSSLLVRSWGAAASPSASSCG